MGQKMHIKLPPPPPPLKQQQTDDSPGTPVADNSNGVEYLKSEDQNGPDLCNSDYEQNFTNVLRGLESSLICHYNSDK